MTDFCERVEFVGVHHQQGIESLELKDFEAQWRWLIRWFNNSFLIWLGSLFHEGNHIIITFNLNRKNLLWLDCSVSTYQTERKLNFL